MGNRLCWLCEDVIWGLGEGVLDILETTEIVLDADAWGCSR